MKIKMNKRSTIVEVEGTRGEERKKARAAYVTLFRYQPAKFSVFFLSGSASCSGSCANVFIVEAKPVTHLP